MMNAQNIFHSCTVMVSTVQIQTAFKKDLHAHLLRCILVGFILHDFEVFIIKKVSEYLNW
jgi:hypothetical protein